jgi:signal transduction histidine kinase/DNA-binding CsgD family transcriptional regulator
MEFPPAFDWRQLRRWGIAESALPPDSQIRFYMPTAWEKYHWQIVTALATIIMLSWLVFALLIERRRRTLAVAESRSRLAELAHLNRNATAMVYSGAIAHELNQPLAAILSNAQAARLMLAMDPPALDDIREILDDIERDDQHASDLIRGMRGQLKKGEVKHEVLDINSVISRAVLFIRPEANMRQVGIRMRLPLGPVHVLGDCVQLQQVLINLVINSMDAMAGLPPAARQVEIMASLQRDGSVDVAVSDAGPGFPGDVAQVFQSFTTTKAHGTGLGLAITAALVREHSGSIVVAIKAGAEDFLCKPVDQALLLPAIERALARFRDESAERIAREGLASRLSLLSPREREVFDLVITGLLNKQIADRLGTSERTIKAHRAAITEKLQVRSAAEMVAIDSQLDLLP